MALIPYDETIGKKAPTQDTQNVGASKATGDTTIWCSHPCSLKRAEDWVC